MPRPFSFDLTANHASDLYLIVDVIRAARRASAILPDGSSHILRDDDGAGDAVELRLASAEQLVRLRAILARPPRPADDPLAGFGAIIDCPDETLTSLLHTLVADPARDRPGFIARAIVTARAAIDYRAPAILTSAAQVRALFSVTEEEIHDFLNLDDTERDIDILIYSEHVTTLRLIEAGVLATLAP